MSMALIKIESCFVKILENKDFVLQYQDYKESTLYTDIMNYLKRELLSLKNLFQNR